jgi:hypothetical protein
MPDYIRNDDDEGSVVSGDVVVIVSAESVGCLDEVEKLISR